MVRKVPGFLLRAGVLASLFVALFWMATVQAQWQSGSNVLPHSHTGPNDGGANISPTGTTTVPVGSTLQVNGTANFAAGQTVNLAGTTNLSGTITGVPTLTGNNVYTTAGSNQFNPGVILGDSGQVSAPQVIAYAQSVDGASESVGCAGVINFSGNASNSFSQWTSTTTAAVVQKLAVLQSATCAPGAVCKFIIQGAAFVTNVGNANAGNYAATSTTRCQFQANAAIATGDSQAVWEGTVTTGLQAWIWIF